MIDRWEGIESFAAVAESGSFTKAAVMLGISVSQVSREVSRLEARLGKSLLHRTTRRVSLTETGRNFEQRCRRLITERDDAFDALSANDSEVKGHLRLTSPVAYGERAIMPIVNRFIGQYPAISIHVELSNALLDLHSGGFDLAIRVDEMPDRRLGRTILTSRKLHCCASPGYLKKNGRPANVAAIEHHRCLLGSSPHWRFASDGHELLVSPTASWRCNSGWAVVEAALQGLGICQLPDFYVDPHLLSGRLVEILEQDRPRDQEIVAVYPMKNRQPVALSTLVNFIRESLESDQA